MANHSRIDLRPWMSPIEQQGKIGSCTPNAIVGAYEYLMRRNGRHLDFSRLFLYFLTRSRERRRAGSFPYSAIQVLKQYGICAERTWPYETAYIDHQPSRAAYTEARRYRLKKSRPIAVNLQEMRQCLANQYPFIFALKIGKSFQRLHRSGWVNMPAANVPLKNSHAMLCVGYSDTAQRFIVRNSWGPHWGHHGYCYIPYHYLTDPRYCFDVHVIYDFGM